MIPALDQPPSEKLTKLKLFLEKNKTDFVAENTNLVEWMNDRKLFVDQLTFSQNDSSNQQNFESVEENLVNKIASLKSKDTPLASSISKEEYESIMDKMVELLQLPAGQLAEESELYLEQQLSDILGFDVLANLDDHRLLFSTGVMKALPHIKRSPTDKLENHTNYHESGINQNRSAFGWFGTGGELSEQAINAERFYISIPLYYYSQWQDNSTELKKWYKFRKAIVINPANKIAVVCSIGDIGPNTVSRKQFGGSPELIHEGKIWSPQAGGKVLVLFVDDQENQVSYGPVYLDKVFSKK